MSLRRLDPGTIPLQGMRLIEASAGTGKTYTITTLVLRLLLEHGLDVDRILVVTFTEAATEELRGRIRGRVRQALAWLEGDADAQQDKVLGDLLERQLDPAASARLLSDALTRMDEAAVYTIHGFCQRMLQEHAFESGAPFEAELITDEQPLRLGAAEDLWRRWMAAADRDEARWLLGQWPAPAGLLQELSRTLALEELRLVPPLTHEAVDSARAEASRLFATLRREWIASGGEVQALLRESPALNRRSYTKPVVERSIATMAALLAGEDCPETLPKDVERFRPGFLAGKTKEGATPPSHPFLELCGRLAAAIPRAQALRKAWALDQARQFLRAELRRRKTERRVIYFDDLLRNLAEAVEGAGGERLGSAIRERYPVALIDEFQDTDPLQYRIFRRIYQGQPECALCLIGDPKQAIYAFRGADVFSYLQARHDAGPAASYTLGTNWRSCSGLVRAVSILFDRDFPSFIYAPDIVFQPVVPGPEADERPLRVNGEVPTPLQLWLLPAPEEGARGGVLAAEQARELAAQACAERIAGLLNAAQARQAQVGGRALRPGDIAVLVRSHFEGQRMQQALRACRVASVTLSQDSVFLTGEAQELAMLLEAVANPSDEGLLRAALATHLLRVGAAELAGLAGDELAWEARVGRFQHYRELWLERGFMVAFQALLHGEVVPARLLILGDGERRMTNLLQLGELLQLASAERPGLDALLRWLADQRESGALDETRQLRLESDEALVKVVTMHKSKGLEYPVVFIPFPWSSGPEDGKPPLLFHDPEDGSACLDLGSEELDAHRALAATEALAERLRLLYVAITRAKHLCVLCWGKVNKAETSALAYLLHPVRSAEPPASAMGERDAEAMRADVAALARAAGGSIEVCELPAPTGEQWRGSQAAGAPLAARTLHVPIKRGWRVVSYSGLVAGLDAERPDHDAVSAPVEPLEMPAKVEDVFRIPGGSRVGQMLHELLEQLNFPTASGDVLEAAVGRQLQRYGLDAEWLPAVSELVGNVLDTPLEPESGLSLRAIAAGDRLNELEFYYPLARLDAPGLRSVLARFDAYRGTAEGLSFDPARGLMRGFIDLVFRHRGRYYIADYKSNHLGDRLQDYGPAGITAAMASHRYDLQYLVYTLALRRYLGSRLPDYDYRRHFGGVYYLFLRGMRPDSGPRYGVHFGRPEPVVVEALDALCAGSRP